MSIMKNLSIILLLPIMLLLTGCYTSIKVPISTYKPAYIPTYKVPIISPIGDTLYMDLDYFMTQYRSYPERYYDFRIYYQDQWMSPWVYKRYYYSPAPSVVIYNTPAPSRPSSPAIKKESRPRSTGTTKPAQKRPTRERQRNN